MHKSGAYMKRRELLYRIYGQRGDEDRVAHDELYTTTT